MARFHRAELIHRRHRPRSRPRRCGHSCAPTVGHMGTELPAERLHRRLGGDPDADANSDGDDGKPDAALSRWLPEARTGDTSGWLAAIRADPGRAGAIALGVVGVMAVLVTVFTLLRDKTPPVVSAKLPPVEMVSSASHTPTAPAPEGPVIVSVVGLVHKPGLVTLTQGARHRRRADRSRGCARRRRPDRAEHGSPRGRR